MPGIAVNVAVIQEGRVLLTNVVRDQSGLSRQQFYLQRIEGFETKETVEIEDRCP